MKKLFFILPLLALTGCVSPNGDNAAIPNSEIRAHQIADWVKTRSGFIENAVSAITHIAVYAVDKDTFDRTRTLEIMHAVADNLNALIANGKVDSESISNALRIDEPYFGPLFNSVSNIIQIETETFKKNGYADLTIEILKAVTAGIKDGTTE